MPAMLRPQQAMRHAYAGGAAAVAALLAMGGTAVVGLLLLDAGRLGRPDRLAAALMAMGVGAPVQVGAAPSGGLPVAVSGRADVLPLGVTLAGMIVLGVLLARRGRAGLLVGGGTAMAVFTGGVAAVAWAARGALALPSGLTPTAGGMSGCTPGGAGGFGLPGVSGGLGLPGGSGALGSTGTSGGFALPGAFGGLGGPGGARLPGPSGLSGPLDAGFAVAVGPAVAGAAVLALAVVALCWLGLRFPPVAAGLRVLRWPALGVVVAGLVAAAVFGGFPAAGGLLLALPVGLALGPTVHADGVLACAIRGGRGESAGGPLALLDGGSVWLVVLPLAVLLGCCVLVAAAARRARTSDPARQGSDPVRVGSGLARLIPGFARRALGVGLAAGLALAGLALVTQASAQVGVRALIFSLPLLDARLVTEPWAALLLGVVAGSAASLLVDAFVGWRPWRGHDAPR